MNLTREFLSELKLSKVPNYVIAQQAGINPTTLSKLINGIEPIKPDDPRILRVAGILGLKPSQVFEKEEAGYGG